ncbi:MAG: cytidylate kinase family protein [Bacteroidota bacterium]
MPNLNITITGDLGSGKSTIAKALCQALNYKYFSTGTIQRQIAREKGMDTLELNYFSEKNGDIDKHIDDLVIALNDSADSFVIDSRMAWHFIRNSFKIYLTVNPLTAANRVIADSHRNNEPIIEDAYEKSLNLLERRAAEDKRFKAKYGVDCGDLNNFDLVIDTSIPGIEDISNLILKLYSEQAAGTPLNKYWVSPRSLYPAKNRAAGELRQTPNAAQQTGMIEVLKLGKDLFIVNGEQIASEAIANKIPLVPVIIKAKDDEDAGDGDTAAHVIETSFDLDAVREWEQAHDFQFESYPKIRQNH